MNKTKCAFTAQCVHEKQPKLHPQYVYSTRHRPSSSVLFPFKWDGGDSLETNKSLRRKLCLDLTFLENRTLQNEAHMDRREKRVE